MIVAVVILLLFAGSASLMFLRKLPAIVALPILALGIGLVEVIAGHLSLNDFLLVVVANGAERLVEPMIIIIFGGTISVVLQKSGAAENLVKLGAELAGSSPLAVSLVVLAIVGLLFTTITGLGAVIMIATIVLPILASVGVREEVAGGILLFGISVGGILNVNNWAVYKTVLTIGPTAISSYALLLFLVLIPVSIVYLIIELWRSRLIRFDSSRVFRAVSYLLGAAVIGVLGYIFLKYVNFSPVLYFMRYLFEILGITLLLYIFYDRFSAFRRGNQSEVKWYCYLIPLVPLVLILVFHVEYIASFLIGFVYSILVTLRPGSVQLTTRSLVEGVEGVAPVIVLIIEIGMLLSSILGPSPVGPGSGLFTSTIAGGGHAWPVLTDMRPIFRLVIPHTFWEYTLGFGLLAPLALYRGPMNVWGLGYGVAGILMSTGQLGANAIMGILMSMSIVQGISDPTNTQNVWLANELGVDVNSLMWRTLPYAWVTAFAGLIIAGLRFF